LLLNTVRRRKKLKLVKKIKGLSTRLIKKIYNL